MEITGQPDLDPRQWKACLLHSFANIVGVLKTQLHLAGAANDNAMRALLDEAEIFRRTLGDRSLDESVSASRALRIRVGSWVEDPDSAMPGEDTREALREMIAVWKEREEELEEGLGDRWTRWDADQLLGSLRHVLDTMAQLSRGRFTVRYQGGAPGPAEYRVTLRVEPEGCQPLLPRLVLDAFRDLVANARKYSPTGTTIQGTLHAGLHALEICVDDEGRGIPPGDLPRVVRWGERGSNVAPHETQGMGAGLAKCHAVCSMLGGRLWIEDRSPRGTRVRMVIPLPDALRPS